jgi:hypothetical protein
MSTITDDADIEACFAHGSRRVEIRANPSNVTAPRSTLSLGAALTPAGSFAASTSSAISSQRAQPAAPLTWSMATDRLGETSVPGWLPIVLQFRSRDSCELPRG